MDFATSFMPRSCIEILDTVVFGIPRSASSSHTVSGRSLLIAAHTHSTLSSVLLVAGFPEGESISTDSWSSLKHLCHTFTCTAFIELSPKTSWIIQIVSAEECSSLTQNVYADLLLYPFVTLNAKATQCTCSLSDVYSPHWLVQWSHHCSHMRIPVPSPWLPVYIHVVQTIPVILTTGGLLLERPCMWFIHLDEWIHVTLFYWFSFLYNIPWNDYYMLYIHPSVDKNLGFFQQLCCEYSWTYILTCMYIFLYNIL